MPVYIDEATALRGELETPGRLGADESGAPHVVVLMCHAHREEVAAYLTEQGFTAANDLMRLKKRAGAKQTRRIPATMTQSIV